MTAARRVARMSVRFCCGDIRLSTVTPIIPGNNASVPSYPLTIGLSHTIQGFDPNIRTPYTESWSMGWQRETLERHGDRDALYRPIAISSSGFNRSINEYNYTTPYNGLTWLSGVQARGG